MPDLRKTAGKKSAFIAFDGPGLCPDRKKKWAFIDPLTAAQSDSSAETS
jgi:hypothetical protein